MYSRNPVLNFRKPCTQLPETPVLNLQSRLRRVRPEPRLEWTNGWVAATHLVCRLHHLQLRRSRHKLTYYSPSPIMSLCKLIYFIYPYFSLVILSIFFSHSNSFKRSSDSGSRSSSASKSLRIDNCCRDCTRLS